jgi:hypothetical protein
MEDDSTVVGDATDELEMPKQTRLETYNKLSDETKELLQPLKKFIQKWNSYPEAKKVFIRLDVLKMLDEDASLISGIISALLESGDEMDFKNKLPPLMNYIKARKFHEQRPQSDDAQVVYKDFQKFVSELITAMDEKLED